MLALSMIASYSNFLHLLLSVLITAEGPGCYAHFISPPTLMSVYNCVHYLYDCLYHILSLFLYGFFLTYLTSLRVLYIKASDFYDCVQVQLSSS